MNNLIEQLENEIREHKAQRRALLTQVYYADKGLRVGIWEDIEYYSTLIRQANEEIRRQENGETERRVVLALAQRDSDESIKEAINADVTW